MRIHRIGPVMCSLALVLAACEPEFACPGDCHAAVIAVGAEPGVLMPPLVATDIGFEVTQQVFLKLADIGVGMNTSGDSGFAPKLAESWEFEDDTTLVFRLHPGARWHDGVPVTARDVAFTFNAYRDTLVNAPLRLLLGSIASVTTRDDRTVAFRFTRAYAEQFYDATHHMWIMPRHLLDTVPRARLATHPFGRNPVGSGPYRFVRWRPGELVEVEAVSDFFLGAPEITRVIWRVSPDYSTALTQVVAGEADMIKSLLGRANVERAQGAAQIQIIEYPNNFYYYVGFNLRAPGAPRRPHPLFSNRELRRAITLGIDREAIKRAVLGEWGHVAGGPTTPMVWIWDADRRQLPFDSARAGRMLTDLGWVDSDGDGIRERNGRRLEFDLLYPGSSAAREQASVIMQEQLRRIGVAVRLTSLEFQAWLDRTQQGRFDATVGAWSVDPPPGAMQQYWTRASIGSDNHGGYANPVFDSLLQLAGGIADKPTARPVWDEALQVINDDAPAVWLLTPSNLAAIHRRFENVTLRPDLWLATLWTWTVR